MQVTATQIIPKIDVLGVKVCALSMDGYVNVIERWVQDKEANYVCITGVHGVMESQENPELLKIHNEAGLVTPDGMPLVWLCRSKGYKETERGYGPDLMLEVCKRSIEKGYTHFFYGGAEGVPELLAQKLKERFPKIKITGTYSPPFRKLTKEEDIEITNRINQLNPDLIWVGISTPKQEFWMSEHVKQLNRSILIGVGAAFDFHAGLKKQAPRWMQTLGLEWFFRLLTEPKRLWKRYLINNPKFIWRILTKRN